MEACRPADYRDYLADFFTDKHGLCLVISGRQPLLPESPKPLGVGGGVEGGQLPRNSDARFPFSS